jgi:phosphoribosylamine-glycine ligase
MDKESPQLIIKAMRLLSSMQLMLTYITNPDLKHHKWVEEAKCPETNPVTAEAAVEEEEEEDKADLKHVADTLLAVLISVGPAVLLNSSITVKFAKSHVQVSDKTMRFNLRTLT